MFDQASLISPLLSKRLEYEWHVHGLGSAQPAQLYVAILPPISGRWMDVYFKENPACIPLLPHMQEME